MPPRQQSPTRGRWRAFALSFLLHSAIVVTAVVAWKYWKRTPPPVETVAMQGTLVDASVLKGAKSAPEPAPPPPPEPEPLPTPEPEEQGPPKPDPAEVARRQEEERQAQEKLAEQKREQEEKAEQDRLAEQKKVELEKQQREEAEKVAAAKAAADKKRLEAEKAAADEKKRLEAEKKKRAAEEAAAAKKAAEEKAREAREAELRRSLEAEERGRALQNSDEAARWHAQIVARIQRAWIKPPSAQPGISCTVSVTQVPGGEVTSVRVVSCSGGDAALRESVEAAVYRASPLPSPPDPALFERNLELTFAPTS